jgi:hypothetical protein
VSEIVCFPVLNFTYSHAENSLFFALDFTVFLKLGFTFQTYQWSITICLFFYCQSLKSPSSFLSLVLLNNILVKIMSYWTSMTAEYCHSNVSLDQCSSSSFRTSFSPDGHFRTRPRKQRCHHTLSLYRGNEFAILRVFESQKSPFTTKIAV